MNSTTLALKVIWAISWCLTLVVNQCYVPGTLGLVVRPALLRLARRLTAAFKTISTSNWRSTWLRAISLINNEAKKLLSLHNHLIRTSQHANIFTTTATCWQGEFLLFGTVALAGHRAQSLWCVSVRRFASGTGDVRSQANTDYGWCRFVELGTLSSTPADTYRTACDFTWERCHRHSASHAVNARNITSFILGKRQWADRHGYLTINLHIFQRYSTSWN